jgi:hypothetical protein
MNRGRAGRFDSLGIAGLVLLVVGSFLHLLFYGGSIMLWGFVIGAPPLFGGR